MSATLRFVPTLGTVLAGPAVWILHFALLYAAMALICARVGPSAWITSGNLPTHAVLAAAAGGLTALAIGALAWLFRPRTWPAPGGDPTARFLGWTRLALGLLSLLALAANALVALSVGECRG